MSIGRAANPAFAIPPLNEAAYGRLFPYYAEFCALSELKKKPGFGVPLRSGIGGHCLLYLNGVQRDRTAGYPLLRLCALDESPARFGTGISVNSHYKNANWVAADGPDFLWRGALKPGERLTRAAYQQTQRHAKAAGMLDGVQFHDELFRGKPGGMAERDYMYEISVATDYAARFGRDTYRARIPLDHGRMAAIVDYLNGLNAPYRDGAKLFRWRLFNNNCVHIAHNALAAAGVWAPWPTGQLAARAMFKFPVPKNTLVDLMLRANDLPIQNTQAVYEDAAARDALLAHGALPTAPGALALAGRAITDNEVYDVERLRLIFFDNPFWGPYRFRFARIFSEPRYFDLRENLRHFAGVYAKAQGHNHGGDTFNGRYGEYIALQAAKVERHLAELERSTERVIEAVP